MDYLSQKVNNELKKSNLNARPSWCRKPGSPNSVSSLSELHNMMVKTKYCNLGNRCTRRNCDFAHSSKELRRSNVTKDSYKTVLCKNYWRMVDGKPVKTCPYIPSEDPSCPVDLHVAINPLSAFSLLSP